MDGLAPVGMTVDEFLRWHQTRPETEHYELCNGEVVAMAPELSRHAKVKAMVWATLRQGLKAAGLSCQAFPDGMTVRIDAYTAYEPDGLVHCGPKVADWVLEIPDPVVVVEVLSPTSRGRDTGIKLADYFRVPSIHHYLIVEAASPQVIHHRRRDDGRIDTRILTDGALSLDPPGVTVEIAGFYSFDD